MVQPTVFYALLRLSLGAILYSSTLALNNVDTNNVVSKLLKNYMKQNSPHGENTTHVKLGIYINSFYSISEQTMDYSLNIYLRQSWYDPRLKFDKNETGREMFKLEDKMWEKLWVPDVTFRNEKKASFHHVTIPNRLMRLFHDGKLWYATKISITLSCQMNLRKYPLDTQKCPMMLESFGHTTKTVTFQWLPTPVEKEKGLEMPQFILKSNPVKDCSQNYSTGSYPCLQVDFILKRDIGYFLIQVYVPTILIVILSWVGFWINIEAIPARVSLGLLTVLTMTTQSSGARASLPRVSYIKAIDVWMSVCLVFVFASLLEFAVVNVFSRHDPKKEPPEDSAPTDVTTAKVEEPTTVPNKALQTASSPGHILLMCDSPDDTSQGAILENYTVERSPVRENRIDMRWASPTLAKHSQARARQKSIHNNSGSTRHSPPTYPFKHGKKSLKQLTKLELVEDAKNRARKVDKLSRRLFPLTFLLFNVVYWVMYTIVK